jgi:putative DNA primase/helicase
VLFDNVRDPVDSSNLSTALTAWPTHGDRILGSNQEAKLAVRCVWTMTGNNPSTSTEMARRSVRIRLDAKRDRPFERQGFRHAEIGEWAATERGWLIWANCVLVQHWLAIGRQDFSGRRLGSFESWTRILGGILEAATIPGFLANLATFYEEADFEGAIWRAFVAAWWDRHQTTEVGAGDLFPIAVETEGFDLGAGSEKAQRIVFGKALARQRERVIGRYRLVRTREVQRAARWRLLPTDGSGGLL